MSVKSRDGNRERRGRRHGGHQSRTTEGAAVEKGMENGGFPREIRVRKQAEFNQIKREGSKKFGQNLILYRLRCPDEGQKFGVKISRGIKGAVKRNRIKRIIRETLRRNKGTFGPDEKVVVLLRSAANLTGRTNGSKEIDLGRLKEELENLIK